jgi:membrane protein YdbS with pleckstrin-like domain
MNRLHPGAKWQFRISFYTSILGILIFSVILSLALLKFSPFILFIPFLAIIFIIIFGEIYAQMAYDRFLYEFGEDAVKIERGIIWKKYSTVPYERVQNVDIRRDVIARMLGFSSVEIQTAGYSGNYYRVTVNGRRVQNSEGYLPAIDKNSAEKIREFVIKKIKHAPKAQEGL